MAVIKEELSLLQSHRSTSFRKPPQGRRQSSSSVPPAGKKPVIAQPTHVGHFLLMVVMKLCRKVLFMDVSVKIGIYVIGVFVASVIADLFAVPHMYFSSKKNLLNRLFVRFGWGWILLFLGSLISLTVYVSTGTRVGAVRRHLLRLAVTTFCWYSCTYAFDYIEQSTGICTELTLDTKQKCRRAGKMWLAFDISGHVFVLTYGLLTIIEECRVFKDWKRLREILDKEDLQQVRKLNPDELDRAKEAYEYLTPYIKLNIICLAVLTLIYEFMLIITSVYRFHSLTEKVAASMIAVVSWFLTYQVIFPSWPTWFPAPGQTHFRFMTNKFDKFQRR